MEKKVVRIQHIKHVSGVIVVILIRHNAQRQGKRVITATGKMTLKDVAEISIGRKWVMRTRGIIWLPLLSSLIQNLALIMKSLQYKLYFLKFLIIKKYLLRNDTKELLPQKTYNDELITEKTDTEESVLNNNSTALEQNLSIYKRD